MVDVKYYMQKLLLITAVLISFSVSAQTVNERKYIALFNDFTGYIQTAVKNKTEISNDSEIKKILLNYLFSHTRLDSSDAFHIKPGEINNEQLNCVKSQLKVFSRFFQERGNNKLLENISATPIRFGKDKYIYSKMSKFQKENTLVFFDKRHPEKILGYMLFIPATAKVINFPRIWSWTLTYQYGKYMFRSVTCEDGYEYIFN